MMTGHTDNAIIINAPVEFVWNVTNDLRSWPQLFTEYAAVEILEETVEAVTFRLTMHPDADGNQWSWVSERRPDKSNWSVRSHRVEKGWFEYMNLAWDYTAVDPDRTLLRWRQDFDMRADSPLTVEAMKDRLDTNTAVQMKAVKNNVEARRTKTVAVVDVPANRKRGADLRTMLSPGTIGSTAGFSGTVHLEPGEVITEHYHPYSEEYLHVVDGELRVDLHGEPRILRPNEAVFVPKNTPHRLVNDSPEPVRVVFFLGPLAPRPDLGHVDTESLADYAGPKLGAFQD